MEPVRLRVHVAFLYNLLDVKFAFVGNSAEILKVKDDLEKYKWTIERSWESCLEIISLLFTFLCQLSSLIILVDRNQCILELRVGNSEVEIEVRALLTNQALVTYKNSSQLKNGIKFIFKACYLF